MVKNAENLKQKLKSERDDILFKIKDDPRIQTW